MSIDVTARSDLPWPFEVECNSASFWQCFDRHSSTGGKAKVAIDDLSPSDGTFEEPKPDGDVDVFGEW